MSWPDTGSRSISSRACRCCAWMRFCSGRVGIALSEFSRGEPEHRARFRLMHPRERALIKVDGLLVTLETDAFVRQCPEIGYARHGFDRARELPVLTCRIKASRHGLG